MKRSCCLKKRSAANDMSVKNWKVNRNAKQGGFLLAAGVLSAQRMLAGSVFISQPPVVTTPPVVPGGRDQQRDGRIHPVGGGQSRFRRAFSIRGRDVASACELHRSLWKWHSIQCRQSTKYRAAGASPGLTVDLGRHWTVDYTPTINFYSSRQLQDNIANAASLTGATSYEDWNFGLSQGFNSSQNPITETGAQTSQQAYTTALSSAYAFNDRWSANAAVTRILILCRGFRIPITGQRLKG